MVRKASVSLAIVVVLGLTPGVARCEPYGGGSGTVEEPYLIYTPEQMNAIGANPGDWDKHFKLMADVDLSDYTGTEFNIIGRDEYDPIQGHKHFDGVFDGNGKRIINFSYTSTGAHVIGLFGIIGDLGSGEAGLIRDLGIISPDVNGGTASYVGALAGAVYVGTISDCYVEGGSVSGENDVGGLVGNSRGTLIKCHTSCRLVDIRAPGGGLAGASQGTIEKCYSTGDVSGEFCLGGLVGGNSGPVTDCYATGNVLGIVGELGGLAGMNSGEQAVIRNCYSTGRVSASLSQYAIGALVGRNLWDGAITDCFWDIETSGLSSMCGDQELGGTGCDCPCGKTTAEMQTESTFTSAGWDFNTRVWTFSCAGPGYPRLAWEPLDPVAHAGDDQLFGGSSLPPLVSLDGSASCDPNGDPLAYQWQQIGGPAVVLHNPDAAEPNFVPLDFGTYVFELVVNDGDTNSTPDTVSIVITNQMPTADAGPDQSMSSLPPLVSLDGTASYDPWADPLTYHWNQIAGPSVVLSDASAAEPNFVPSEFGRYVLQLVVNDGLLDSDPDIVSIVIGNNHPPVADAGSNRYAAQDPATLDGTSSYDPDGYGIIDYQWQQVSGPPVVITGANTPTPTISGFTQTSAIQECSFALVVSDSELGSIPDTVKVIIVPDFSSGTELHESKLTQLNPPFDPNRPTIFCFNGGVCEKGGGFEVFGWPLENLWHRNANIISVYSSDPRDEGWDYDEPFNRYGDMLIVYLSSVAPDYKQPIQTVGMSTGGQPALEVGIRMNLAYKDRRYTINRVTLLDPGCDYDYPGRITDYLASRVGEEQCWVDHYISDISEFYPGALTVEFPEPPATHGTPWSWYINYSDNPDYWTAGMYDRGLAAGAYLSVIGPGKNLQLNTETTEYYFVWNGMDSQGSILPGYLEFFNESTYPGRLPEPVTLIGPEDGAVVDANGALLSCEESENAVGYELLFGRDPYRVTDYMVICDTANPPNEVITKFPFEKTYWTIKVRDQYGSTIYADPICIRPEHAAAPARTIENLTTGATYDYIQAAIDDASGGDEIVVSPGINPYPENIDFKGKNVTLRSINPNDPNIVASTVIKGGDWKPAVTFANTEKRDCVVAGFTISGGSVGVHCSGYGTAPKVTNCLVTANKGRGIEVVERGGLIVENSIIAENQSDGVHCSYSRSEITNCTVTANQGIGIDCSYSGRRTITNCIIWDNSGAAIERTEDGITKVTYSDVDGGFPGEGNIDADPCFADAANGDYHLKSQAGRWDPTSRTWVYDDVNSPCIDAGDPDSDWTAELWPHGKRINMGAYGGRPQASMSLSSTGNRADLNDDGTVDSADLAVFVIKWLFREKLLAEDVDRNKSVDFKDFAVLADNWLWQEQ